MDLVKPTITDAQQSADEIVDRVSTEISADAQALISQISNLEKAALEGIQASMDKLVNDIRSTIISLDGWTVTINVPQVTLRLSKPSTTT